MADELCSRRCEAVEGKVPTQNVIPHCIAHGRLVFLEECGKDQFPKVATLEPGGLFKEYDLHKVQSSEISLVQMDALSVNYWLMNFVQENAKPSKERYPPKTLYHIVCGLRRFINMRIKKICIRV